MKLRDHPGMSYRALPNWPPVWTNNKDEGVRIVRGELGSLEYVYANERISNKCFLVIKHQGERYVGALIFSDRSLCQQMTGLLRQQIGKPIRKIGDLELSHTL